LAEKTIKFSSNWACPICKGPTYSLIGLCNTSKSRMFKCNTCSIMFADPTEFDKRRLGEVLEHDTLVKE
jgi:hypothetical protein